MKKSTDGFASVVAIVLVIVTITGLATYLIVKDSEELTAKEEFKPVTEVTLDADESEDTEAAADTTMAVRDSNRQIDISRLTTRLEEYWANNNGTYPAAGNEFERFIEQYFDDPFVDPTTNDPYVFISGETPTLGEIRYEIGFDGNDVASKSTPGSSRLIVAQTLLESGETYCQDNSL